MLCLSQLRLLKTILLSKMLGRRSLIPTVRSLATRPLSTFLHDSASAVLSKEQIESYENNGYFVVRGLLMPEEVKRFTDRFLDIANGTVKKPDTMLMMRDISVAKKKEMGDRAITKLQKFEDDEVLFSYSKLPSVLKYVSAIIGPDIKSMHTMMINKPPDTGLGSSRHPPHQDLWYFPFRPVNKIVACWAALQEMDEVNGCLEVEPGTHKGEFFYHSYPNDGVVNKAYHGIQGYNGVKQMVKLPMSAGDAVFFHPLLVHGSGPNNSERTRKAISTHYASTSCEYIDVTGTIQEDLKKEIEEMAAWKGVTITLNDYWRTTSRFGEDVAPDLIIKLNGSLNN